MKCTYCNLPIAKECYGWGWSEIVEEHLIGTKVAIETVYWHSECFEQLEGIPLNQVAFKPLKQAENSDDDYDARAYEKYFNTDPRKPSKPDDAGSAK